MQPILMQASGAPEACYIMHTLNVWESADTASAYTIHACLKTVPVHHELSQEEDPGWYPIRTILYGTLRGFYLQ